MNIASNLSKYLVVATVAAGLGVFAWQLLGRDTTSGPHTVTVAESALSAAATTGRTLFEANCAVCHGLNAAGTDKGPPLIHDIYNPGHHPDGSFFNAAKLGVRQHHWPYGDMPPQRQVTEDQVAGIVQYIRELQAANGIRYRPHRM